jgi:hypothetical protein
MLLPMKCDTSASGIRVTKVASIGAGEPASTPITGYPPGFLKISEERICQGELTLVPHSRARQGDCRQADGLLGPTVTENQLRGDDGRRGRLCIVTVCITLIDQIVIRSKVIGNTPFKLRRRRDTKGSAYHRSRMKN